jgi:hypothetical protein
MSPQRHLGERLPAACGKLRGFADRARNIVAVLFLGIYFVSPHMDITATVENSATTAPASHE